MFEKAGDLFGQIFFDNPERLFMLMPAAFILAISLAVTISIVLRRPKKTFGSRYPLIGVSKFYIFFSAMLALAVVAWAQPYHAAGRMIVKRGSAEIICVLDVSSSMYLKGIGAARIDVATREILRAVSENIIHEGDRAALFVFGSGVFMRVPLSKDLERFSLEVSKIGRPETLKENMVPWGSDIAIAIQYAYQSLDRQDKLAEFGYKNKPPANWLPRKRTNRIIFLFTDGDFFSADDGASDLELESIKDQKNLLDKAMGELKTRGVRVYPIGIGPRTPEKLIDILKDYKADEYSEFLRDDLTETSGLNVPMLEYFERKTGGRKFIIEHASVDAQDFMHTVIEAHRGIKFESVSDLEKKYIWPYFIYAALTILVLAIVFY